MRKVMVGLGAAAILFAGCGDDSGGDASPDGSSGCSATSCDDGVYCNGLEICDPSSAMANAAGCVPGAPPCGTDPCDESSDACEADCVTGADADRDGFDSVSCGGTDCDDSNPSVNPGVSELCDTEDVDEDCNPETFGFLDADGDGQGSDACCNGDRCGTDCNDGDANVAVGRSEACDGLDNDCDTQVDEGVLTTFYVDDDGDDFGDPDGETMLACAEPAGFSERGTDCDDSTSAVNPGVSETCDGYDDNDCNSATPNPHDDDGDGFDAFDETSCPTGLDCDDGDPNVHAGAPEICDGKDTNCDGSELVVACVSCSGTCMGYCSGPCAPRAPDGSCAGTCEGGCVGSCDGSCSFTWEVLAAEDYDDDGYMDPAETCSGGPRDGRPRTDCDDLNGDTHPGAPELCDGKDNDCDGVIDEDHFDTLTEPMAPMAVAGGAAPDLSCRGVRTRPAPGATTSSSLTTVDSMEAPVGAVTFQLWTSDDAPSLTCGAPGCSVYTTDGSGDVTVTHASGSIVAYVVPGSGALPDTLGLVQPGVDTRLLIADADADTAIPSGNGAVVVEMRDCAAAPISTLQVRAFRDDGLPHCGTAAALSILGPGRYLLSGFSPAPPLVGELLTIELWGRPATGAPFELVGRERIRIRPDTISVLPMGPLRADGPPAP